MGIYLEAPNAATRFGKSAWLAVALGATTLDEPTWPPPEDKLLVCVVHNAHFEAALIVEDEDQFVEVVVPDGRKREWLLVDSEAAISQLRQQPTPEEKVARIVALGRTEEE
jgi:hypothetical protein